MFSPAADRIREQMQAYAVTHHHQFITTEHLLLALIDDDAVWDVLARLGADYESLSQTLKEYLAEYSPKLKADSKDRPQATHSLSRVIQLAIWQVQASRAEAQVDTTDLLVALFSEDESFSAEIFTVYDIDVLSVMRIISAADRDDKALILAQGDTKDTKASPSSNKPSAIDSYTVNLNAQASAGKTDPLIGRSEEIYRCAQILCRRRKNNPLLVGDPGVGKTAIAEGLAWLIVNQKAPAPLNDAVIYSLDIALLMAGTKFRGEFEARMKELLNELADEPHAILFIDEIHMVIGAGSTHNSSVDVSNLIKPALAKGDLCCIGSTTFTEYRQIFEKDHALSRRFQKLDIQEPSQDDAVRILQGLQGYYEDFHGVEYTDAAITAAVQLSAKHIHERFLPDKAIDVIDEAGAHLRLQAAQNALKDTDGASKTTDTAAEAMSQSDVHDDVDAKTVTDIAVVDEALIEQVVAKIARIPPKSVSGDDKDTLYKLDKNLKQVVFGQDEAVEILTDAIKLSRAGLANADKPIGSFLFSGPTGVGKTEISRQLAFMLGIPLVRFDMSEYMEAHTASRLIGAPPGYVGYDQGGLLTEKIIRQPHCVLLLDELEKAHSDVFNLLLQVMDHGTLTDNNGRAVSFKQVILIMTTNVGAESISRQSMGFTEQDNTADNSEALKRTFTPEFRNRLDAVVNFSPLTPDNISFVVDKFITELQAKLTDKNVILSVDNDARAYLANKGYDKLMGARPMARLIQNELKKPLAQLMLFGELAQGGQVTATVKEGAIEVLVR